MTRKLQFVHTFRSSDQRLRRSFCLLLALAAVVALGGSSAVYAQSLNDQVVRLLSNNCAGLLGSNGNFEVPLDDDLARICNTPPAGIGSSAGGGSAAVQSSTASVQNRVLQRRLSRAKEPQGVDSADAGHGLDGGVGSWSNARAARASDYSFFASGASGASGASDTGGGSDGSGDLRSRRFDLFLSFAYERLDRNLTDFENGYSSSVGGATVGFDYRFSNRVFAGLLVTIGRQEGDFDGFGDFEIQSLAPSIFATILPSKRTYLQLVLGRSTQDLDVLRGAVFVANLTGGGSTPFTGTPTSSTDGVVNRAGAQFGYDFSSGRFTYGPRAALNYALATIDPYSEANGGGLGLIVDEHDVKSFQGMVGFFAGLAVSSKSAVFLPQINIEYVREFEDVPILIGAQFVDDLRGVDATTFQYQTNVPDTDFFNADLGLSVVIPGGIQPYLSFRAMFGNDLFDSYAVNAGVRFEL